MTTERSWTPTFGDHAARLNSLFEHRYLPDAEQRANVFSSASNVLAHGPGPVGDRCSTGLALGHVQSGKTMSFTALAALAADNGFRLVIAMLGSTDLLLDQNTARLRADLELDVRDDYRWIHLHKPAATTDVASSIDRYLELGQTVLITILKNANQVGKTARLLGKSSMAHTVRTLIIDDEADQISLNTRVRDDEVSRTYEEIGRLRAKLGPFLYAQYTATPFAPLLLEARDMLSPSFVEVLDPGPDYTGGEVFFIERSDAIVRHITEQEALDVEPQVVPGGLRRALASFFAGAALLRGSETLNGPISMLIHPSHLTVVHARYKDMVETLVRYWGQKMRREPGDPGRQTTLDALNGARRDLVEHGAEDVSDHVFEQEVTRVLSSGEIWMVNSLSDVEAIDWPRSPVHILIGGNKLDRGFTVRGLTITYMTRRATGGQADTIEQRARAFGYKRSYVDSCRFFAPRNVIDAFTGLVHTENDLRASLLEWIDAGRPIARWAEEQGLVLPGNIRPTRPTVIFEPEAFRGVGWHTLRRPDLAEDSVATNASLVQGLGLLHADRDQFGRGIEHRRIDDVDVLEILEKWSLTTSPGWEHEQILDYCRRRHGAGALGLGVLLLLEAPNGEPRVRKWDEVFGVPNLMQGSDERTGYPGDRNIHEDRLMLQIHRIQPRGTNVEEVLTLALYIPRHPEFGDTVRRRSDT